MSKSCVSVGCCWGEKSNCESHDEAACATYIVNPNVIKKVCKIKFPIEKFREENSDWGFTKIYTPLSQDGFLGKIVKFI